jgi:hypothetical protein
MEGGATADPAVIHVIRTPRGRDVRGTVGTAIATGGQWDAIAQWFLATLARPKRTCATGVTEQLLSSLANYRCTEVDRKE